MRLFLKFRAAHEPMFEFFFKYPRSVYARGQFALLGAWPKWMLVVLILAAAAVWPG
jgi:hypothetical protein